MTGRIPLAAPDLSGRELEYVTDAIASTWISSTGPYVERFEREFATLCDATTALSVCNGTAALHLALLALDVRPGDEILVPSLTYIATANAARYVGAEPVFVDVDPATWCLDPGRLEESITGRTVGILPVHLYGHPADMDAIGRIAERHGLWVVEDAAQAHLARYKGRRIGGLGRIGTFSFYGNKILTSGEGGAVVLQDETLAERARMLRGQGMDPQRRYFFPIVGHNFRLTNVACAILCAQLERADEMIVRRRVIFGRYDERLAGVSGVDRQPRASWADPVPWVYCITLDREAFGCSRDELAATLASAGIETRPFFLPLHTLPPYAEGSRRREPDLAKSERLGATGLSLPTFTTMSLEQVDRVCDAVLAASQ